MPMALVAAIKTDGVASKKLSHDCGKGDKAGSKQKMCIILHEHPCVTGRFSRGQQSCKSIEEILSISIVSKYFPTLYSTDHDMVQSTGCV
jgi:hypothetical protein